ncbi:hypothetical protein VTN02DRAFT_4903 [Thermoascus thermophilus]
MTLSIMAAIVRWLRLKVYQYEVTFAIYMLTPTEKFIFNSLLISLVTLLVTAAYVYLPDHVMAIGSRAYYYWAGDRVLDATYIQSASSVLRNSSTPGFHVVYETATRGIVS